MEVTVEDVTLRHFKTRIYLVEVPIDEVANPIKAEEICIICQERLELEESIGKLGKSLVSKRTKEHFIQVSHQFS